eukprot:1160865-Pelagomonas_calceolata.AAC.6
MKCANEDHTARNTICHSKQGTDLNTMGGHENNAQRACMLHVFARVCACMHVCVRARVCKRAWWSSYNGIKTDAHDLVPLQKKKVRDEAEMLKKVALMLEAIARPIKVLPVPASKIDPCACDCLVRGKMKAGLSVGPSILACLAPLHQHQK